VADDRARWDRSNEPGRRLFVAVPLPAEAMRAVAALVEGVRATDGAAIVGPSRAGGRGNDVRWVRLDGLHVTLRFLGPTVDPLHETAGRAVAEAGAAARAFDIRLSGGGAFPGPDRPRALWLGIADGATELAALAAAVNDGLERHGWPRDERPFRPHLTVARSDGVRAGPRLARALIAASAGLSIAWRAHSVVLFESLTGGGPARYVPLLDIPFGESATASPGVRAGGVADRG
jgi:RNA 2',3'-cyclic 3'-phosphodiesterase